MIWFCLALCCVAAGCFAAAQTLPPGWWTVALVLAGAAAFLVACDFKPKL